MAVKSNVFAVVIIALMIANTSTCLRNFPVMNPKHKLDLAARLQANEGNTNDCWSALSELRQCSNEVVGFFLNGQTNIDAPCCDAIEFITGQCWPSMLGVLGFTSQEGNLLAGFCKKTSGPSSAPPLTTVSVNTRF